MSRDIKFFMICNNCSQKVSHTAGNVNHDYQPLFKGNMYIGLKITYRCFDCETTETKELLVTDPIAWTPKDKKDFQKKMGIKKPVIN